MARRGDDSLRKFIWSMEGQATSYDGLLYRGPLNISCFVGVEAKNDGA